MTNKHNLPEPLLRAVQAHEHKGGFLSASQTTKSVRQYWLEKRHASEIEEDVSEMIWALLGTACHYILHKADTAETLTEQYLSADIAGEKVTGTADLYHAGVITDYKVTSVWSVIYKSSFADWEAQLNMYAFLYRKAGFPVNKLEIVTILRDWQKSKSHEDTYPPIQVQSIDIPLWTAEQQEAYLTECIARLQEHRQTVDVDLPECTPAELWQEADKYAVMKKGRKSALRLLDSEAEAQAWMANNGGDTIVKRTGKPKRCEYCRARDFCNQYKYYQEENNGK